MTLEQLVTLLVLAGVVIALIWDKVRADVVALAGAALLLLTGAVRPSEVQGAFGSPAIIALASLFVIAHAMELSGLLDLLIRKAVALCGRIGSLGLWLLILMCGGASGFLNNTPIVVLAAPVVRDVATSLRLDPKRFLMPLSYVAVLGGCCTLIGTSTNLLVDDMARSSGQAPFSIFEITPVGLVVAAAGGLYLFLFSGRLLAKPLPGALDRMEAALPHHVSHPDIAGDAIGDAADFAKQRPLAPAKALTSTAIFAGVILLAALNITPIAASAFAGAVLLILLRVIRPEEAYGGLRPEILMLIVGMVVIGIALEQTGLASSATNALVGRVGLFGPLGALILLYGATLVLTELLSNATVAVLVTPIAVALAESLHVSPRPFLVAVMMAGSAAFATPFGYQTNVLVYQMAGYSYLDFTKVGLPLNLVTWFAAVAAIHWFFPF
ncbi:MULTISPECIES: SLC13 family permease [Sphingobium]|uniref:SLC13 family permease n=1 Tax=Sphingobium TaxID=165695 RepID=UPI00042323D8|nr:MULTISPECIES: SLC13 family permease [Sphingobium]AMK26234.1 di- and tricarboxylate transporters-like protein [Sphingobium sp. TKS]KMS58973.1 carboxylate transporter [Sphingobium baderi LL03]WRD78886.1 SLC13 family permease [Sphingobium baderi]